MFYTACLYRVYLGLNFCDLAVILRRRHYMEKIKAPKHRPFHRRHNKPSANRLGADVERNSGGIRQEKSRCEPDQPGQSSSAITLDQ